MSEWLIDIIKEWVLSLAYATEAWVSEWFTPYSVTGPLNPNATCLYFKAGTHDGKPYYRRSDGEWFIWWDSPISWVISQTVGSLVPVSWFRVDPNLEGPYLTGIGATGTATVSLGYRSLCTSFVDRGDPAVHDFLTGDLTLDGAWHVLDLSGIVPAGAKGVCLSLQVQNAAVSRFAYFRKFGNVNTVNVSVSVSQVAANFLGSDITCPVDSSQRIEYAFFGGAWTFVSIAVKGWWF